MCCSRPEDGFNTIRVECIVSNYPASNDTFQITETAAREFIAAFEIPIYVNNSDVVSGTSIETELTIYYNADNASTHIISPQLLDSVMLK